MHLIWSKILKSITDKSLRSPKLSFSQALKLVKALKVCVLSLRTSSVRNGAQVYQNENVEERNFQTEMNVFLGYNSGSKRFHIEIYYVMLDELSMVVKRIAPRLAKSFLRRRGDDDDQNTSEETHHRYSCPL